MTWIEIRIVFAVSENQRNWQRENYDFIKHRLLPLIRDVGIEKFLILNYYERGVRDYIRFRIATDSGQLSTVTEVLDRMKRDKIILDHEHEEWIADRDAQNRIASVGERIGRDFNIEVPKNWMIAGRMDDKWVLGQTDYMEKINQFEVMLEDVIGQCTRIFIDNLEERPNDRWLMSLFVHLILNSLCYSSEEELQIRDFPAL